MIDASAILFLFVWGVIGGFSFACWLLRRDESADARDAARYRHLRSSWVYTSGSHKHRLDWPRIDWYLPRYYGMALADQLDASIDDARRRR